MMVTLKERKALSDGRDRLSLDFHNDSCRAAEGKADQEHFCKKKEISLLTSFQEKNSRAPRGQIPLLFHTALTAGQAEKESGALRAATRLSPGGSCRSVAGTVTRGCLHPGGFPDGTACLSHQAR